MISLGQVSDNNNNIIQYVTLYDEVKWISVFRTLIKMYYTDLVIYDISKSLGIGYVIFLSYFIFDGSSGKFACTN